MGECGARTTRIPDVWASPGAVHQRGGVRPVARCGDCGDEVVWLKSRRGRWYLAEVRRGESGRRYYRGDDLHPRDCAERVAAELVSLRREEKRARIGAELADAGGGA